MQIGELGSEHARAFQELRLAALRECPSAFASSYEEEHDTPIAVVAERLVAKPDRCVLGAWLKSDLVGMVGLQREQDAKAVAQGVYLGHVCRSCGAQTRHRAADCLLTRWRVRLQCPECARSTWESTPPMPRPSLSMKRRDLLHSVSSADSCCSTGNCTMKSIWCGPSKLQRPSEPNIATRRT